MGTAAPPPTLHRLRQTLAGIDPSLAPRLGRARSGSSVLAPRSTRPSAAGFPAARCTNLPPRRRCISAAASGFARASPRWRAGRAGKFGQVLWVATDFAVGEGGGPYGPGLDLFGMAAARLLMLRVPRAVDVLWAMEEALRCRALACVIAELTGEGAEARSHRDAPACARRPRRRRPRLCSCASVRRRRRARRRRRWEIAASPSQPDAFGGLGRPRFDLSLRKNRRGPSGRWIISGIIMNALSTRRYLSVWLRRLSTDRIERRLPAPADGPRVVALRSSRRSASSR